MNDMRRRAREALPVTSVFGTGSVARPLGLVVANAGLMAQLFVLRRYGHRDLDLR